MLSKHAKRQFLPELTIFAIFSLQNRVLKQNNVELSRNLEDMALKVQLMVAESATTDDMDKEKMFKEEMEKQVSLARKQRDEAVNRLHSLQEQELTLKSRIEESEESRRELETRLLVNESKLETLQAENAHLRDSIAKNSLNLASNASQSSFSNQSSSIHKSSIADAREIEALQLELDELRSMRPVIEVLERDAAKVPDLERTIDNLRLELTTAQSKRMNEEALQIQVESSILVQRQLEATVATLTKENVKLKDDAHVWSQTMETLGGGGAKGAEEISNFFSDLQAENLRLLERLGESEAQLKINATHVAASQKKLKEAETAIFDLKNERSALQGSVAQRDGKIVLLEGDLSGMKALLDSYKMEEGIVGTNIDEKKNLQISALETMLADQKSYVTVLEKEIEELKTESAQVAKHAKRLADEKNFLEIRVGRGDVDASRTRVLHFAETPLQLMYKKESQTKMQEMASKAEDLESQLKIVVEQHSQQLQQLQQSGGSSNGSLAQQSGVATSSHAMPSTASAALQLQQEKEVKMLRHQYQESKVAMDRMKAATEVAIRRYMSSVWNVFGWKVDFEEKNRVKVRYKYWNDNVRASQAVLLFEYPSTLGQKGVVDQLEPFTLLDSPYSQQIPQTIVETLRQPNTLPLFIAKLTIHLFEMVSAQTPQRH